MALKNGFYTYYTTRCIQRDHVSASRLRPVRTGADGGISIQYRLQSTRHDAKIMSSLQEKPHESHGIWLCSRLYWIGFGRMQQPEQQRWLSACCRRRRRIPAVNPGSRSGDSCHSSSSVSISQRHDAACQQWHGSDAGFLVDRHRPLIQAWSFVAKNEAGGKGVAVVFTVAESCFDLAFTSSGVIGPLARAPG